MTERDFAPICDIHGSLGLYSGRRFWDRFDGCVIFRTMREAASVSQYACKVCVSFLPESLRQASRVYFTESDRMGPGPQSPADM